MLDKRERTLTNIKKRKRKKKKEKFTSSVSLMDSERQHPLLPWQLFSLLLCWTLARLVAAIGSWPKAQEDWLCWHSKPWLRFKMCRWSDHITAKWQHGWGSSVWQEWQEKGVCEGDLAFYLEAMYICGCANKKITLKGNLIFNESEIKFQTLSVRTHEW